MADNSEDFGAILREQEELRRRLLALDRKIDAWKFAQAPKYVAAAPAPVEIPKVVVSPPLPPLPPAAPPNVPTPEKASWEFKLGTVWLVRIGIVVLLTGFVFLGNYAYQTIVPHLTAGMKLALLYLLGGGLAALGARLEKRSATLQNYGRVLLAGGVALIYYTTYGATFVEKIRVIENPLTGGLLLLGVGALIIWIAEKRRAQTVALTAILLSYYTSAINPLGLFSLYSSLLLTGAAVFLLLRHRWTTLSFFSLAGTYASYAFWRFHGGDGAFSTGCLFLLGYWILFTVAVFFSRAQQFPAEKRTPFLSLNNAAFFGLVFQSLHAHYPAWDGRFCLGFGAMLLLLAAIASRLQEEDFFLDGSYLMQGLAVLTLGISIELSGYQLSIALAIQGTVMLFGLNRRHGWFYALAAGLVSLGAFGVSLDVGSHDFSVRGALIGLFILDAWLSRHFRKNAAPIVFSRSAAGYSLLAVLQTATLLSQHGPAEFRGSFFCVATLALLILGFVLKLRELAIVGQFLVLLAGLVFIFHSSPETFSTITHGILVATPLALIHWWQWQKDGAKWQIGEVVFSLLTLFVASRWIFDRAPGSDLMFWLGTLAVAALVYGTFAKAQIFALLGQIWIVGIAGLFFYEVLWKDAPRFWPTLTLLLVPADLGLLHFLAGKFTGGFRKAIDAWQIFVVTLLFLMICLWGYGYIELPGRMLYFIAFAGILLHRAACDGENSPLRSKFLLAYAALATVFGLVVFGSDLLANRAASWLNVLALIILAAKTQFAKSRFAVGTFPAPIRYFLIVVVVSGLWFEINRWIASSGTHFPKSLAWALLAVASLCVGLAIRERTYRLCGFLLLAVATARLLFFEVEGLNRILCFIALGILILVLGFIYNKFADKLREWL